MADKGDHDHVHENDDNDYDFDSGESHIMVAIYDRSSTLQEPQRIALPYYGSHILRNFHVMELQYHGLPILC